MSARVINSVIARALVDAAFYGALVSDPERALDSYNLGEGKIKESLNDSLDRIGRFAGFITKVQNNFLWDFVPLSRALLRYYRLEPEIFLSFRERHQELRRQAPSREIRAQEFQAFLLIWVKNHRELEDTGLYELAKHELIQLELRFLILNGGTKPENGVGDARLPFWDLVPRKSRFFETSSYQYDPVYIAEAMLRNEIPRSLMPSPRTIGYLGSDAGTVQLFEISPVIVQALALMDGSRTLGQVLCEAGIDRDQSVEEVFRSLETSRVISFVR